MLNNWSGPTAFRSLLVASLLAISATTAQATPSDVVISQVYGGGGNAGSVYKNDFIELHNRGASTVSLAGWSVQYAATTGSSWSVTALSGSIPPGGYYLVQEAAGAGGTTNLPTPDATGSIAMALGAGKVALVSSTSALSGSCPAAVDFLGYGSGTNCFEGSVGPTLSNTTAALRNVSGCADTDNNASDFSTGAASPRNSASSAVSCQLTLSYLAGANGSISGTTPQSVTYGGSGAPVTAVADAGYHFVSWSDGVLTASRTEVNVTADLTVTASFAINQFTLTYTAGANGSISGTTPQTVNQGADGTAVTAVPDAGYHFVSWSDGVLTATRTDTNVQADITVTASFAINQYTLTYLAGANGSISGATPQTVNHGADGTAVTAVPDAGYHFVSWSDGVLTATRTDTNVQGNITVTASFAINSYTLTYLAGANGSISGTTPQVVAQGADGTAVTAVPDAGYHFVSWSDGVLTATRTDTNVQADLSVSASFGENLVVVSQIYGGGGNTGATYTNDFIELYNRGPDAVDLTGWTVQYASAAGTSWSSTPLSGVIQSHKYFLVQEAAGVGGSLALPTPDATGGISMNATAGKVALVNDGSALSGTCPSGGPIEDLVGYGAATCSETNPAPTLSNTTAGLRHGGGCVDTDDNSADFSAGAPNPRNSASAANNCTFTLAVNVDPAASGTVSKSPDLASYAAGAVVQLTATPADGYHFDHWSGGATGSATPLDVTISGDLAVTAHFLPTTFASQMVISQLYGGGGNTSADYTNDYVELYNRGNAPATVTGWTIQYASPSGTVWGSTTLIGVVPPGHYYLVQESSGGGGTTSLPAPDAIGTLNLGASDGKLALVSNNVVLTGSCPSGGTVVDMLGYGSANCSESSPAAAMSNTLATLRNHDGCDETNDNAADFASAAPAPRNSASPANICDLWLGVGPRPAVFSLSSPRPNPSHGLSQVSFGLPTDSKVRLTVSDVMGRHVASLVDGVIPAGQHEVSWAGVGDGGPVRSGLYYFTLEVPGRRIVRSFVLVR